ncbi:SGNH hydrolase domain-containing protein [Egicoccus sp. AB-alg6-2]|uniref:SGNH hydrolase domain-containing protein n=1 Tax=Egicoccus sp. AB-alg6-2 TaxID=3242692 RepID=UPI00359E77C4
MRPRRKRLRRGVELLGVVGLLAVLAVPLAGDRWPEQQAAEAVEGSSTTGPEQAEDTDGDDATSHDAADEDATGDDAAGRDGTGDDAAGGDGTDDGTPSDLPAGGDGTDDDTPSDLPAFAIPPERVPPATAQPPAEPTAAEVMGLADVLAESVAATTLPAAIDPPPATAGDALSQVYTDDCFTGFHVAKPADCVYGAVDAPERTVVLFGDSHAAHWFPPLHDLAVDRDWRLVPYVKASCPSLHMPVVRDGDFYPSCTAWRGYALDRIAQLQPDLVVLSSVRDYEPVDRDGQAIDVPRADFHARGLARMIERLREVAPEVEVAVIGTTPHAVAGGATCLAKAPESIATCASSRDDALAVDLHDAQREVAARSGAVFIDASTWMCHEGTCPAVIGDKLVHNVGSHLAPSFTRWLRPVFEEALLRDLWVPPTLPVVPAR